MYLRRSISNIHNTSETAFLAEHCPELSVAVHATHSDCIFLSHCFYGNSQ